jgi:hypothetical protein
MKILLIVLLTSTIFPLMAANSNFSGVYKCSGGYDTWIEGSKVINNGLVHFKGKKVSYKNIYDPKLEAKCGLSYYESVSCDESTTYDESCYDEYSSGYVDEMRFRNWNLIEVYLSSETAESICSNVPSLKSFTSNKELAIAYVKGSLSFIDIGENGEYDIPSTDCISVNF